MKQALTRFRPPLPKERAVSVRRPRTRTVLRLKGRVLRLKNKVLEA